MLLNSHSDFRVSCLQKNRSVENSFIGCLKFSLLLSYPPISHPPISHPPSLYPPSPSLPLTHPPSLPLTHPSPPYTHLLNLLSHHPHLPSHLPSHPIPYLPSYPPLTSSQLLGAVFLTFLTPREDYLRALRSFLRELVRQVRNEFNFAVFARSLMREKPAGMELQNLDQTLKVRSRGVW